MFRRWPRASLWDRKDMISQHVGLIVGGQDGTTAHGIGYPSAQDRVIRGPDAGRQPRVSARGRTARGNGCFSALNGRSLQPSELFLLHECVENCAVWKRCSNVCSSLV